MLSSFDLLPLELDDREWRKWLRAFFILVAWVAINADSALLIS